MVDVCLLHLPGFRDGLVEFGDEGGGPRKIKDQSFEEDVMERSFMMEQRWEPNNGENILKVESTWGISCCPGQDAFLWTEGS